MALWWWIALAFGADVRGMTVSCPTWGWEWGTDAMVQSLDVLAEEGVTWVSIHPYAQIRADGTVSGGAWAADDPPEWIVRPIAEARKRGMKILIKPHLAYWGSGFSWRGDIAFETEAQWARFFASYGEWMERVALAARGADALAVGTELDRTVHRDTEWRQAIVRMRSVFSGALTYAANWDSYEKVPFWNAVDVIGIQAYFPLGDATRPTLSDDELAERWSAIMSRLAVLGRTHDRHVVFTELGYSAALSAHVAPWKGGAFDPAGEALQVRALSAALRAIDQEPTVIGAFLWKWFPGEPAIGDFRMSSPAMRAVIRRLWGAPPEVAP